MPTTRRVAATFDPDELTLRERGIAHGALRYARQAGWHLVLDPFALHHPGEFDGLLVQTHRGLAERLKRCPVPFVCVAWSQRQLGLPGALDNRYKAGRIAARHLVERGYRTCTYLGFRRHIQSRVERQEFTSTLSQLGCRTMSARTFATYASKAAWWAKVMRQLGTWLDSLQAPAGLFVARPGLARAVAELARGRGLRIPEDLGIVAADDDPLVCTTPPALTSLHFDYPVLGTRAAERLDHLLQGKRRRVQAALVAPTLVQRLSTDRQRVDDPLVADALWFIDSRRSEAIDPHQVAEAMGVDGRTLRRRLRRAGRGTPAQEIARARVEHAKLLLAQPDLRMGSVAREAGFPSYDALLRAFKRYAHTTPAEWRRQNKLQRQGSLHPRNPQIPTAHQRRGLKRT